MKLVTAIVWKELSEINVAKRMTSINYCITVSKETVLKKDKGTQEAYATKCNYSIFLLSENLLSTTYWNTKVNAVI
jgi:hypothetical protein